LNFLWQCIPVYYGSGEERVFVGINTRGKRNEGVDTGMTGGPGRMLELINWNGCQTMESFVEQGEPGVLSSVDEGLPAEFRYQLRNGRGAFVIPMNKSSSPPLYLIKLVRISFGVRIPSS
jgi:hypothetical protein